MKTFIIKIYNKLYYRYLDYRYKIPENAGICFSYYLIMSIIPICSIFAFLASILNIDLSMIRDFLYKFLTADFSNIIIEALQSREIKMSSLIAIGVSFWVVSRGINQLYGITKNLFPPEHERGFIIEQIFSILKTVLVFILLIVIISMLSFLPIVNSIFPLNKIIMFDDIYLFLAFFIILFLLYKIIPDVHVNIKDIFAGTFVASLLLTLLLECLEIYFSFSNYSNVYGSFASIAVVLFSFNFIAEVIYIGLYVMFEAHMKRLVNLLRKQIDEKLENTDSIPNNNQREKGQPC